MGDHLMENFALHWDSSHATCHLTWLWPIYRPLYPRCK